MNTAALVHMYVHARIRCGEIVPLTGRNHYMILSQFALLAPIPAAITKRHVRKWQDSIEHLAQSTKRNRLTVIRAFCRWMFEEGHCPRNACKGVRPLKEPRRVPRALEPDAVAAILEACTDTRERVTVILMVQLGLRRGEVARLEVGDFDMNNRLLRVTGKGGHQRVLFLTDQARTAVIEHLAVQGTVAGPLLRSQQFPQRGLHPDTVSAIVRRVMTDAGVKRAPRDGVSPHALRHSALTDMLRNGAHVRDVQAVAGHQHLATTEVYLPLLVGTLQEAMEGRTYGTAS